MGCKTLLGEAVGAWRVGGLKRTLIHGRIRELSRGGMFVLPHFSMLTL